MDTKARISSLRTESDVCNVREEFNTYSPWTGLLVDPKHGDSLIVRAEYCKAGSDSEWTLSVENTDRPCEWPIRFGKRPDREEDPAIHITVPDGTTITEVSS
ncbi:hypothetical protein [Rhodococcus erythropolis]|uniref:hypothetical protein n=1 Tax=Rhodococcus erythropolis TaxID=1833 RepID=UPI001F24905A|nr:hypothetical protein [Rhodococcus erythropolis]